MLHLIEAPTPAPRRGEVGVRVEAAGVAFGDVMRRRGVLAPPRAFTPGYDVVGVIDAVGAGVDSQRLGQRVAAMMPSTGLGGYATHVCLHPRHCVPVPATVSAVKAIALGLNYITAWQILHRVLDMQAGQRVLIHGAAGGVGTAALQLGRRLCLEMYGTASARKHSTLLQHGATPIDYRAEDFVERVTADGGVDAVLDPIGGDYLYRSYSCLRERGTVVSLGISGDLSRGMWGALTGTLPWLRLKMTWDSRRVRLYLIHLTAGASRAHCQRDWAAILQLHEDGALEPHIGAVIPLEEVARAHDLLDRSAVVGKVVLTVS